MKVKTISVTFDFVIEIHDSASDQETIELGRMLAQLAFKETDIDSASIEQFDWDEYPAFCHHEGMNPINSSRSIAEILNKP
jgi:hypothetical protein